MKTLHAIPFAAVVAAVAVAATAWLRPTGRANLTAQPAQSAPPVENAGQWDVPDFLLVDQDGRSVSKANLRGNVWIADFIFTGCAGACPILSQKMQRLQSELPLAALVSFDVDPDRDTPSKLRDYGAKYGSDFSRWHFLASPSRASVFALARGMRVTNQSSDKDFQLLHSDNFFLVDADGKVCGVYDTNAPSQIEKLIVDARRLAGQHD